MSKVKRAMKFTSALAVQAGLIGVIGFGASQVIANLTAPRQATASESSPDFKTVSTQIVDMSESFLQERVFTGVIEAATRTQLAFEISGRIAQVNFDVGEDVASDAALMEIEVDRTLAARERLEASLRQVDAELQLARIEFERAEDLVKRGASTVSSLDRTRSTLSQAQATREGLVADMEALDIDLSDSVIRAPFDGIVLSRSVSNGTVVQPGEVALEIVDLSSLEAQIGVPSRIAQSLSEGDEVTLVVEGVNTPGRVKAVLPLVSASSRTQTVLVEPADRGATMIGQTVSLLLSDTVMVDGFWVPLEALVADVRGLWAVQVADQDDNGTAQIRRAPVQIIHTTDTTAYINGALSDGDRIVATGSNRVFPGERVVLAEAIANR